MKLATLLLAAAGCYALSMNPRGGKPFSLIQDAEKRELFQDIVTWDEHSLFIHGERAMMFSAEVHPFRLPVPSLYVDLLQKIKAMGFNMVSFYVDWALLEGKPGEFQSDSIFNLEPFFEAAQEVGIYLLPRPGPYINAEVSGGGFPGWLQRVKGVLRTSAPDFLSATDNYMEHICSIIAKYQITNGGPVILFQPENEYSAAVDTPFPDQEYLKYVNDQARDAGIVVPLINNDAWQGGTGAPGTGVGAVDIYGHDGYPLGFNCGSPNEWAEDKKIPTDGYSTHMEISPNTPYSIIEFQGGAFDPPGGWGFEQCSALVNQEFARVFYKNNLAAGVTIFNIYMTFGGTNWGNLGHCDGYTSYDYGAAIKEDRTVTREKYSEIKLQGQFLRVSPGYITSTPKNLSTEYTTNKALVVTPLTSEDSDGFYVVRHGVYNSTKTDTYKLQLPTSSGKLTIPQLGGSLSLHGRDSKVHVTDYAVGDYSLLYSTAEIFTWKKFADKTVLVLYGGPDELHEVAVKKASKFKTLEGDGVKFDTKKSAAVFQWKTSSTRRVIQTGNLVVYLLDRNTAYNYWVPDIPGKGKNAAFGSSIMNPDSVIINGGYLVRSISVKDSTLSIHADFNTSTPLEVIGAPKGVSKLSINGDKVSFQKSKLGNWVAQPQIKLPKVKLPQLSSLDWHHVDSLPEISSKYDDSQWPDADHTTSNNTRVPLQNDVSLYGSDYGFHAGALLFRGHFTAKGTEEKIKLWTQGGRAFAHSVWLDDEFLGSFTGFDAANDRNATITLPRLKKGRKYVLTVVVDNTGLNGNWTPGYDEQKNPRGILNWVIIGSNGKTVTKVSSWKLTGNLGGEDYADQFRGPLNEGGFFFERQGYHLPKPPLKEFKRGKSPLDGLEEPGVNFYTAKLSLSLPSDDFDIPLSFAISNSTDAGAYRALLYVNGFQYGRYSSNIGPQSSFPVPEGVLNYRGENWIGVALWALEKQGARLPSFELTAGTPVQTGRDKVKVVRGPAYKKRKGAY